MNHAPTLVQSCLHRAFPRPTALLLLRCTFLQPKRSLKSTTSPVSTSSNDPSSDRSTTPLWFIYTSGCRRKPWSHFRAKPYNQTRSYTSKPGEYGNLSEKDFREHSQKVPELSLHDIRQIMGKDMTKKRGNEILSRLQKRRITGTLDHEGKAPSADAYIVDKALAWLRKTHPLDEEAAIMRRIEREEGDSEKAFIQEAERLKNWHPQQGAEQDGVYGKPMVDEFAKMWNERRAAKIKEKEEWRKQYAELKAQYHAKRLTDGSDGPAASITKADTKAVYTGQGETAEWIKRYKEKGRLSDMLEPPKMSKARRLLPLYAFSAVLIAFCAFFAVNYKAPPTSARIFPDIPVSVTTLQAITAINLVVYFLWALPPMWRVLNKNFLHIIAQPAARTLITAAFSHQQLPHLLSNMFGLWLIGLPLHEEVGRGVFLSIFFVSSITGGLAAITKYVWMNQLNITILGASGAVCGIWAAWAWLPSRKSDDNKADGFKSFGSWIGRPDLDNNSTWFWRILLLTIISAEFSLLRTSLLSRDHWGHIGGYFGGIACAEALLWRARKQQREEQQQPQSKIETSIAASQVSKPIMDRRQLVEKGKF